MSSANVVTYKACNFIDEHGNPDGGSVEGLGLSIQWQRGSLAIPGSTELKPPNGAFVETVIRAAKQRIEHYQELKFRCQENADAITKLDEALAHLESRLKRRESQGILGSHTADPTATDKEPDLFRNELAALLLKHNKGHKLGYTSSLLADYLVRQLMLLDVLNTENKTRA